MEDKKQKINASFCSILGALVEDDELRLLKEKGLDFDGGWGFGFRRGVEWC